MNTSANNVKTPLIISGIIFILIGISLLLYNEQKSKPEKAARDLYREAVMLFERGDNESLKHCLALFTRIVAQYPETDYARRGTRYIARVYEISGLKRLAYLKYIYILKTDRALDKNEQRSIKTGIARLLIDKDRTEEAIYELMDMLKNTDDPGEVSRIYTELGHTYLKTKDFNRALRMFDIALNEQSRNEEAVLGKARAYKHLGHTLKAFDLYDYFLQYYGKFSSYTADVKKSYHDQLYSAAYHAMKKGDYTNSQNLFTRFLRRFPGSVKTEDAQYFLGECFYAQGMYSDASNCFLKVLKNQNSKRDEISSIKIASSYFLARDYAKAGAYFEKYIASFPSGRYRSTADQWLEICRREIKLREDVLPEAGSDNRKSPDSPELNENLKNENVRVMREYDDSVEKQESIQYQFTDSHQEDESMEELVDNENVAEL